MKWPTSLFHRREQLTARDYWFFGGAIALYVALTLGNITRWSIWFDEAFSAYLMRFDFFDIARYTANDVHPPMYYWLLKAWTSVFGTSDLALRLPSLLMIAASIVVIVLLVRKLFSINAARWTALLLAISPLLVRFGEEARMYSLALLITSVATYVLVSVTERPTRKKWLAYAVLVSLGMWTHYFTALVWLAHWVWRWSVRREYKNARKFWTKEWILAHVGAIALYLPWLPFMAHQLGTVQGTGFWIQPVTADTPVNSLTNVFLYLDHGDVKNWFALLFVGALGAVGWLAWRYAPKLHKTYPSGWKLILALAFVPPLLMFVASLPPLRPSYIDRYILPALTWMIVGIAVLVAAHVSQRDRRTWLVAGALIATLGVGVYHVYQYGNLNRNATPIEAQSVKQVVADIAQKDSSDTPIVADSPWRFYEAVQYDSSKHQVYFVGQDDVTYGSYDMLRDSDFRKISDVNDFAKKHGAIWYIANWYNDEPRTPKGSWRVEQTIVGSTPVAGSSVTRAYKLVAE
jgi:uncharacterized membrane protein